MARPDLLALSPDDLAALTNRGTVKRAQRELEAGEVSFTLNESDTGEVKVEWSDGAACTLPAGKAVADARCSCPATTLCRHVVRSVLAYQQKASAGRETPPAPQEAWDPGAIGDEELARHYKKAALTAARGQLEQGLLVELVRSAKPTARFHQLSCTLRFAVPGDVRYAHCDCAQPAPCGHVPLAVWAFRLLPADKQSGIISTQQGDLPVPSELLESGEALLGELVENGFSGLPPTWKDRAARAASAMEAADLVWPAEVLAEIGEQLDRYRGHDARFSPARAAELVGEWLIRADAIRGGTRAVPQLLVRGSGSDRATDIGSARYVGLGCGVRQDRGTVTVTAFLQDSDSGSVVGVGRDFADPAADSGETPKDFHRLAATPVVRGVSLSALGAGQLLLQGGKRAPDHRLQIGRARASVNPQGYAWESLRAPLLAEDFAELRARLAALPPASLRARYLAEDLHVVSVAGVDVVKFDEAAQSVEAVVRDARGELARLHHPYLWRGREGCEVLLAALGDESRKLRFVAGQVRSAGGGLLIQPIMLVFEKGQKRIGLQPWLDIAIEGAATPAAIGQVPPGDGPANLPARHYAHDLIDQLGELLLLGLRRADARLARNWQQLADEGEALGYDRLVRPVAALAGAITRKLSDTNWTGHEAQKLSMRLALLARLMADLQQQASPPDPA